MKEPPYHISICGKHDVERFVASDVTHLLSLEDPGTPRRTPSWFTGPHVQLQFHDLDTPQEAVVLHGTIPTEDHVKEILRVGASCLRASAAEKVHLLVHCYAGISRSTAASYALVAQAIGVEQAPAALEFVLKARPEAFPNLRIVRHADHLLRANGQLVAALQPLRDQFSRAIDEWAKRAGE